MALRALRSVSIATWSAGLFLVLVFLTGGSARAEATSLVLLRPVAAVALVLFAARFGREDRRVLRWPAMLVGVAVATIAIQLIPLPPSWWTALPGREALVDTARLTGQLDNWRPVSLVPWRTLNALLAWLVPVAAGLAAAGAATHRRRLMGVVMLLGLATALLGMLQLLGGGFHLYGGTATDGGAGLFANRNHHALLLAALLPMLAAFTCDGVHTVEDRRRRLAVAAAAAAMLVPLILVTGSRAGAVLLLVGAASVGFVYRAPLIVQPAKRGLRGLDPIRVGLALGFAALVTISFLLSRATSITRLMDADLGTDTRAEIWQRTVPLIGRFLPTGAGFGTFVETYQLDEPRSILRLTYANHAHNDWLEVVLDGGVVGASMLLAGGLLWGAASWKLWRCRRRDSQRGQATGRAGAVIVLMTALASIVDYPARTPIIAAVCAIAVTCMAYALADCYGDDLAPQR